jgi:hypothetical protein
MPIRIFNTTASNGTPEEARKKQLNLGKLPTSSSSMKDALQDSDTDVSGKVVYHPFDITSM